MKKFNIIKSSRKKSKVIDEKIEYLNKECQKTGLQEVSTTSGVYSVYGTEPNPDHEDFRNASVNGLPLGFSGANHQIDAPLIGGAAYSPPHPITGERYAAGTWKGILTGFRSPLIPGFKKNEQSRPHGDVLWYWKPDSGGGNWRYVEKVSGQWCVWIDNAFGSMSAVPYFSTSSNLPDDIKNALTAAGVLGFTDPEKFGPPTNPILFQNDLGDPSHIPINIDGMSPEAYNYLDTASSGYSDDTYNWYVKTYGAAAAGWYMNNPNSNPKNNPFLPGGAYTPFTDRASNPTDDKTEIALPPAAILAAMMALGIAFKGAESAWKMYRKYKQQIDQKIKEMKAEQGQTASYEPVGDLLSEAVKLGYFEPEVLNVDINDIRKGIMPEFPKDPPPEMIGGYSAKSRLVRKDPELPPFIKVTRKDLAKYHKLTDKEIQDFLDDVKRINDYIKKNPAELIYAMTRYPKDDPRLAQLNFKMDEMKRASDRYVETHFPENISLFNKLQNKIRQNIEMTNPNNFTGHAEAPKFIETDISEQEKRRKTIIRHFKKKK